MTRNFQIGRRVVQAALLLAALPCAADPSARDILERMEQNINGYADQAMDVTMTVVDVDGAKKSYDFTVIQKGDTRRMVRFTSGELKGMATLIEGRDRVYVYLPGFKKVRRVAASNMNQSFAGSDMTSDDMSTPSWTALYDAAIDREDATSWTLRCTPKPGAQAPYAMALLHIEKARYLQLGIEYRDASGTPVKIWENRDVVDFHGVPRASLVEIRDPRTNHRTQLHILDLRVNQGLRDALFTVRELEWGS